MTEPLKIELNPLDKDDVFSLSLCNPNPKAGKFKIGTKYKITFELTQEEWQWFMDAEIKGMVIEAQCYVTHRNTGEKK